MAVESYKGLEKFHKYLQLENKLENPPLVTHINPENVTAVGLAGAAAHQCYSKGDIFPSGDSPSEREKSIAASTLRDSHNTVRQHKSFTFQISNISRFAVQELLHAFAYYNSDQQSQRYAKLEIDYEDDIVDPESVFIPEMSPDLRAKYEEVVIQSHKAFQQMQELLQPYVEESLKDLYKGTNPSVAKAYKDRVAKTVQETARYFIPLCQKTKLYFTVNELQLLRFLKASDLARFTDETRYLIASMINEVSKTDPTILFDVEEIEVFDDSEEREITAAGFSLVEESNEEFDNDLGNSQSKLESYPENSILMNLIRSIRLERGWGKEVSDDDVLEYIFNPKNNRVLLDRMGIAMHDDMNSPLKMLHFIFNTKLSCTAYAQAQRHRGTPQSVVSLKKSFSGRADYIVPTIIKRNSELETEYIRLMEGIYRSINECVEAGMPIETAVTLLPNAHAMRITETGDLLNWLNRWFQRLCYNAQDEIFHISDEQTQQVLTVLPFLSNLLVAPCTARKTGGAMPWCTESRKCRRPVWLYSNNQYRDREV